MRRQKKKKKSPNVKKLRKVGSLVSAWCDEDYENFRFCGRNCEYLIHFHKKKGLTSWAAIPSLGEDKEEIESFLRKIDEFRVSLYE